MENKTQKVDENKLKLYQSQKETLKLFLSTGAISKEQYEKSLNGLKEKMGIKDDDN